MLNKISVASLLLSFSTLAYASDITLGQFRCSSSEKCRITEFKYKGIDSFEIFKSSDSRIETKYNYHVKCNDGRFSEKSYIYKTQV